MDLKNIIEEVIPLVKEVGAFIREESGKVALEQIEQKSLNNLVSYVDKTAEKMLVSTLSKILPDAVFLTEEGTIEEGEGEWKWVVDPLDGTTNFLHQIPLFSVSIGLMQGDKVKCGWVYDIMHDDLFYAWKDGGAYLNGKPIKVSQQTDFEQSLLVTGFPYGNPAAMKRYVDVFYHLMMNTRGVRRLGSAAIDLAYVACGRFEGFYEYRLNPWDVAGGAIILQEAGGTVTDFEGGDDYIYGKQIVATNGIIDKELLHVIQEKFLGVS
jgi:myo-inositol-1(or 4)-monophosphatase